MSGRGLDLPFIEDFPTESDIIKAKKLEQEIVERKTELAGISEQSAVVNNISPGKQESVPGVEKTLNTEVESCRNEYLAFGRNLERTESITDDAEIETEVDLECNDADQESEAIGQEENRCDDLESQLNMNCVDDHMYIIEVKEPDESSNELQVNLDESESIKRKDETEVNSLDDKSLSEGDVSKVNSSNEVNGNLNSFEGDYIVECGMEMNPIIRSERIVAFKRNEKPVVILKPKLKIEIVETDSKSESNSITLKSENNCKFCSCKVKDYAKHLVFKHFSEGSYCNFCRQFFNKISIYNCHMSAHNYKKNWPIKCSKCQMCFYDHCKLYEHEIIHKSEGEFISESLMISIIDVLQMDLSKFFGSDTLYCRRCTLRMSRNQYLRHLRKCYFDTKFICDNCSATFFKKRSLVKHFDVQLCRVCVNCTGTKPRCRKYNKHECPNCGRIISATHFERHYESCDLKKCRMCSLSFDSVEELTKHVSGHLEKIDGFQCSKCHRLMSRDTYQSHSCRRKLSRSNFKCFSCEGTFQSQQKFREHFKSHKKESFLCRTCDVAFKMPQSFKCHIYKCHNNVGTVKNVNSTAVFDAKSALIQDCHLDIANEVELSTTGVEFDDFQCLVCPMVLVDYSDLREHMMSCHPVLTEPKNETEQPKFKLNYIKPIYSKESFIDVSMKPMTEYLKKSDRLFYRNRQSGLTIQLSDVRRKSFKLLVKRVDMNTVSDLTNKSIRLERIVLPDDTTPTVLTYRNMSRKKNFTLNVEKKFDDLISI